MPTTNATNATNATRSNRRSRGLALVGGLVFTAVLALTASTAGATIYTPAVAGVYRGNQCQGSAYVDNAGAEACAYATGFSHNRSVTIQIGAYDYAADGHSARTDVQLQQYVPGPGWINTGSMTTTVTNGRGYTRLSSTRTIARRAGATQLRLWVRACTYESSTSVFVSCAPRTFAGAAW